MDSMSTQFVPMPSPEGHESSNKTSFPRARYLCFGAFHLDPVKEELFKDGARVKLQAKVYQVLLALLEKPGETVTREELRIRLWPSDARVNYDANVNTSINKLRQVLGDSADQPAFVNTIPRKGYSFVAKVEFADRPVTHLVQQPPRPADLSTVTTAQAQAESKAALFRVALTSAWFTGGVVTLVIASMLFGAALVLYAHH
jgi:DNA-binding winged helix-turn-helix (wHTH) protein